MNRTPEAFRTENEAADWLVRLDADRSPATWAEFEEWLEADARNRAAYLRLERGWRDADRLRSLRPLDGSIDADVLDKFPAVHTNPPEPRSIRIYAVLLGTLALLGLTLALWYALSRAGWQVYRTELGGFQRVLLRDGSTALLNTNTEVRVRMTGNRREIRLARGEALFNIESDLRYPLDVWAGGLRVRALGTAFDVRVRNPTRVEVLVSKGSVAIDSPRGLDSTRCTIPAEQAAAIDPHRLRVERLDSSEIAHRLAWTQGRLWFEQNTLAEAVEEFNRYNRRQLVIADPAIAGLRIGGSFDATDPDAFVAALAQVFDVRSVPSPKSASGAQIIRLVRVQAP